MSKLEEKVNEILGIDKKEPSKEIVKQEFKPAVPRKKIIKKKTLITTTNIVGKIIII